jgi:hypothetical protein
MDENKLYHQSIDEISNSGLKLVNKSPAHYEYEYLIIRQSEEYDEEKSDALIFGSAFHTFVLENHLFADQFVISPKFSGSGSRMAKKTFLENNKGKFPLSLENYIKIEGMANSIKKNKLLQDLLNPFNCLIEHPFYWTNPETGVKCKIKPDVYNTFKRIVLDLKSTEDASTEAFRRDARKYRYNIQAPFYFEGLMHNGMNPDSFIFVAVEKTPPYLVNLFYADNDTMANGREIYLQDLQSYSEAKKTGNWCGYGDDVKPLNIF